MLSPRLEERIEETLETGVAFDHSLSYNSFRFASQLYMASLRDYKHVPRLQEYAEVLENLNFQQKLLVYKNLEITADYYRAKGWFKPAIFYGGAAEYFWNNFVLKSDRQKQEPFDAGRVATFADYFVNLIHRGVTKGNFNCEDLSARERIAICNYLLRESRRYKGIGKVDTSSIYRIAAILFRQKFLGDEILSRFEVLEGSKK